MEGKRKNHTLFWIGSDKQAKKWSRLCIMQRVKWNVGGSIYKMVKRDDIGRGKRD